MGYEQQIHEAALALGGEVAAALQPARDCLARASSLNEQLEQARAAEEKAYAAAVEKVVSSGKLPAPNGIGVWAYDSVASLQVVAAVSVCRTKAAAVGREAGPRIFEALQAKVQAIVGQSVELAGSLPDFVNDERSAVASGDGGKHFATWVRLGELLAVWEACHELNRVLQRAGWCDGPEHANDRTGARTFQAYEKPPPLVVIPRGPRERHLAAAATAGAEPGLYPWGDAVARWQRIDRRLRPYVHMEVVQTHDSRGNVLHESKSPPVASEFMPSAPAG